MKLNNNKKDCKIHGGGHHEPFPMHFNTKHGNPRLLKNSFYAAIDCVFFLSTYLHVGTSYRQWHSPHLGLPDTYLQGKMPLKKRSKTVGNAVSFLFSLEDGSAASTSSFPLPACHEPPVTERIHPDRPAGGARGNRQLSSSRALIKRR